MLKISDLGFRNWGETLDRKDVNWEFPMHCCTAAGADKSFSKRTAASLLHFRHIPFGAVVEFVVVSDLLHCHPDTPNYGRDKHLDVNG